MNPSNTGTQKHILMRTLRYWQSLCASPFLQARILPSILTCLRRIPFLGSIHLVSLGEAILLLPLIGLLVAGYITSFVQPDVEESGNVAFYAMAVTFALANKKNSILSIVLGISWERLVPIHYVSAVVSMVLSCFHGWVAFTGAEDGSGDEDDRRSLSSNDSPYSLVGSNTNLWKYLWDGSTNFTGTLITFSMAALLITSMTRFFFRRFFFEFWLVLHVGLSVSVIVFSVLHEVGLMAVVAGWWTLDWLLRLGLQGYFSLQLSPTKATIQSVTDSVVEIRFPRRFEFEAGQFVRIAVPAVGYYGPQFHPATISSAPYQHDVTLHFKAIGGWSKSLLKYAEQNSKVNVWVEGPYGHLSLHLEGHSRVLLICGGIGVTPMVSLARQLLHERKTSQSVRVIWAVRDLELVRALPMVLGSKQHQDAAVSRSATEWSEEGDLGPEELSTMGCFNVDVYVTKQIVGDTAELGQGYAVHWGSRPDIGAILEQEEESRLAVIACGPQQLVDATSVACRQHSGCSGTKVIDFHHEIFDY